MLSERIVCREFVGRAVELEHLRARRRAAAEGRGGLVLVTGEAGIGKSRLLREFCTRLAPARHRIASSACLEFAQRPLQPLATLLRDADGASPFDERAPSRDAQLAAVAEAFDRIGDHGTAVLALEDLHWADGELLQTLGVLAERAVARRILLVATYRDDEIVANHPLFVQFGRLLRVDGVSALHLGPLSNEEAERLLRAALGAREKPDAEMLREVVRRSGGNPLFTEELLRHVVDYARSGGTPAPRSLPLTLQAVVRERLNRCSAEERELLAQGSLFGRSFRADLLAEIFELDAGTMIPALRRLCELQLIDPRDNEPHGFQFRHALTRDAVYGEMLQVQTRPLHQKIARMLGERIDAPAFAEMIAHSYWEAGELDRAAPYCELAGDAARDVHAYDDAANWFERAAAGFSDSDADAGRTLGKASEALLRADAIDRLLLVREAAAASFLRGGDLVSAIDQRNLRMGALANDGRPDEARAYGEATLELARDAPPASRAAVLVRLAAMEAAIRQPDEAWTYLERIDENALADKPSIRLEYFAVRSSVAAQRAAMSEWRECYTRAFEISRTPGISTWLRRWLPGTIAVAALNLGELAIAREYQARSLDLGRANRLDLSYALAVMSQIEFRAGNVTLARRLFDETRPTREYLPRLQRVLVGVQLATALGDRALLERCADLELVEAAAAGGNPFTLIEAAAAVGLALDTLGRMREAATLFERAVEAVRNPFGLTESIAIVALRAPHVARRLRPLVAAHAERPGDRVNQALLALLDAAVTPPGEIATRARRAAQAGDRFAELGWPLFEARARELAGDLEAARRIYSLCGAEGDVQRIGRTIHAKAPRDAGVLTEREGAIAAQVAAGMGNRAVAARLAISEKAVEKSLTAIYGKLGLRSRAQLAAFVAGNSSADRTDHR
jgi:DNA-binding CsgD family transcriptional regulator/tetratricopeptide (TPR) repeat protein